MLVSPLTYAVYPWSVHCKCAMKQNWRCFSQTLSGVEKRSVCDNTWQLTVVATSDVMAHCTVGILFQGCGLFGLYFAYLAYTVTSSLPIFCNSIGNFQKKGCIKSSLPVLQDFEYFDRINYS